MPKAKLQQAAEPSARTTHWRRLAWALMLVWLCVWGLVGVGPWLGIPDLPQDSPAIRLIPVGIGIAGAMATRRHPLAGGVYWLVAGFLLSSLLVVRLQSVADIVVWCAAALPALITGVLLISNLTPEERESVRRRKR